MVQETPIVNPQKLLERIVGQSHAGRGKRARDQRRSALSHHPADLFLLKPRGAASSEELAGGVGEVAAGVHQGAVQIEDDQAKPVNDQLSTLTDQR